MSVPANATPEPGETGLLTTRRPSRIDVISTIATASAPRDSMPPVAIGVAVPAVTVICGTIPVASSSSFRTKAVGSISFAP